MPHEIDGKRAIYARTPAWHRIGTVMDDVFTADEALATLNPDKTPVVKLRAAAITPDGQIIQVDSYDAIAQKVDGEFRVYSFMSPEYGVVQLEDKFRFMDEIVSSVDGAHYCAAAKLRGGKQTVITIDLGSVNLDEKGINEPHKKYLFGSNSYDGSWALRMKFTDFRVECANMAAMALRGSTDRNVMNSDWSTRHSANVMNRVDEAKRTLGMVASYSDLYYAQAENMIHTKLTDNQFARIIDDLFMDPVTEDKDLKAIESVRATYELNPTQSNLYGTVWGGFNAVTHYNDWGTVVRGGKTMDVNQSRFIRQLDDTKGLKQRAWDRFSDLVNA